jgi:hypothetical protein
MHRLHLQEFVTVTRSLTDNTIIRRFGEMVGSAQDNYSGSVLLDEIGELHQGEIAEIVIVEGADTEEQREVTEGELAHKYGIQSELPSWHPYVTSPP